MKRNLIAVLLGSLVALPAFANDEIDAGSLPQPVAAAKSRAQVFDELLAAKTSYDWRVNAELGTQYRPAAAASVGGKSRSEVRAETEQAYRNGELAVFGEIIASHL